MGCKLQVKFSAWCFRLREEWCWDRSMKLAFQEPRVRTSGPEHSVFCYQALTSTGAPSGTSPCMNLFESALNFYLVFLDKGWVFWRSLGRRGAYKCQWLIAKLQAAQQGSGEMEQRKWHFVVETFKRSDSCRSGHYELIPGWLMDLKSTFHSRLYRCRCLRVGRVEAEAAATS